MCGLHILVYTSTGDYTQALKLFRVYNKCCTRRTTYRYNKASYQCGDCSGVSKPECLVPSPLIFSHRFIWRK